MTRGSFGAVHLATARPVPFAEYSLFHRDLLQKRHIILRSLLIVATPRYMLKFVHVQMTLHWTRVVFIIMTYCLVLEQAQRL